MTIVSQPCYLIPWLAAPQEDLALSGSNMLFQTARVTAQSQSGTVSVRLSLVVSLSDSQTGPESVSGSVRIRVTREVHGLTHSWRVAFGWGGSSLGPGRTCRAGGRGRAALPPAGRRGRRRRGSRVTCRASSSSLGSSRSSRPGCSTTRALEASLEGIWSSRQLLSPHL